jgi:hypothetical protein
MQNEIDLSFCIWGFEDITPDEITSILGIEPFKIYNKGQRKNPNFLALAKQNGWIMKPLLHQQASFEDQMNAILDIIEAKIDLFKPLCEKYYCEFSCALFIRYDNGESTPWIHLNARYNELIKKVRAEFDVDIYCLPNEDSTTMD